MERAFGTQRQQVQPQRPQRPARPQELPLGVPQIAHTAKALGIPGVQKGFTPSAAASVPASAVAALFAVGDRVMHRKFGEGNVVEIRGSGADARVVISFAAYGMKEFVLSIAPIVKVNG